MSTQEAIKDSICYMCTAGCPTKVHVRDGKAIKIEIANDKVAYCPRWQAQLDFIYHPGRLQHPMKRTGQRGTDSFTRISWDEALDTIAANLQKVKDEYGPESVVFWIAYTKEPRPYFHRLTHAFGSPNYCTESSSCFSATWIAANLTYGSDYSTFTAQSGPVEPETRCKLIWSSSVKESAPMVWQDNQAAAEKSLKLIVVDPRRTDLAAVADIHLQPRPGTDGALALGMMNVIINQNLYDKDFTEQWTAGFDDLSKLVQQYPPERVAEITWVPAAKIRQAALLYATQKPAKIHLSPNSTTHHSNGVQNHRAVILLAAITGNFEVAGGNRFSSYGLPITKDITLHERVAEMPPGVGSQRFPIWSQRYREMQSNAIANQIESGDPYPIKAIFSAGLNVQFFPNTRRLVENLKKLDFIAVSEYFPTPGTQMADIVLPVASWLERRMLFAESGDNVKLVEPAIDPVGESWPEWKIYSELAGRLGFGELFWDGDLEKCLNHRLEPLGITCDDLRQHPEGIKPAIPPRPEKYYEKAGFQTPSGKVEIASATLAEHGLEPLPVYKEPPESPLSRPDLAEVYPLVLTSGARVLAYTHSQFRNITPLRRIMPDPLVDINPADAKPRGIKSGDAVTVSSPRGSIKMKANVTDSILAGVVATPHHWPGEANVNILIDDQNLDPISGFPPFKSQLCQVSKA